MKATLEWMKKWVLIPAIILAVIGISYEIHTSNNEEAVTPSTPATNTAGAGGVTPTPAPQGTGATPQPKAKAEGGGFNNNTLASFGGHNTYNYGPQTEDIPVDVSPSEWSDPVLVHGNCTLPVEDRAFVKINERDDLIFKVVTEPDKEGKLVLKYYQVNDDGSIKREVTDLPWQAMAEVSFKALKKQTKVVVTRPRGL